MLIQPSTGNVPAFLAKLWKMVDNPETGWLVKLYLWQFKEDLDKIFVGRKMKYLKKNNHESKNLTNCKKETQVFKTN